MAVGAALVGWEEPWISLICKLREKNVEEDSQYTFETSQFIPQMTRYIVKQRTEFDYYCRSSRLSTTTFMSFHSIVRFLFSILAFLFQFLLPFYSENEVVFCVSAVIPSLTFSESSDQYIGVSQSLLCCSQLFRCVCVCVYECIFNNFRHSLVNLFDGS